MKSKKIPTAGCLTLHQRDGLEDLKRKGEIKSLSQGIRNAVGIYLRKNPHKMNDKKQKQIAYYNKK